MNTIPKITASASAPRVSVIIPTFGREEILCDSVKNVLKQDYPDFELIIVDQTPRHLPSTTAFLQKMRAEGRIKLIFNPVPNTPSARNEGLKTATGEIIIFVDDDVEPAPDFIKNHAANYADPLIAAVAGKVIPHPPAVNPDAWRCRDPVKDWWWFKCDWDKRVPAAFAGGCNMSFRKSALDNIGGFDENYVNECWGEETDPCFRLRKRGHVIMYDPGAALTHFKTPAGGSRALRKDQTLNISLYRNVTYFFLKNLERRDLPKHFMWAYRCYVGQEKDRILKSPVVFGRFLKRNLAFAAGLASGTAVFMKLPSRIKLPR